MLQRSCALLPTHLCVEPGSGLWPRCCIHPSRSLSQLLMHSAGLLRLHFGGLVWSHEIIFGMLWRSSCQHLCCLQNAEITMSVKKALSIRTLKHRRFFFLSHVCLLCVCIATVDGNLLESLPSLFCWFRPSIFHPLFPLRAVLAGQSCFKMCC